MKKLFKAMLRRIPSSLKKLLLTGLVWDLREQLGKQLFLASDGKVQSGPLKGFKISGSSIWSGFQDLVPKLTGSYEEHLFSHLNPLSHKRWEHLIVVGAADGYWAVGLGTAGLAKKITAFETDEVARTQLAKTAQINLVDIDIRPEFDTYSLDPIGDSKVLGALVLVDIEGGSTKLTGHMFLLRVRQSL